ncbi:MAG: tRNA (N(6)-L-threonylcarbamoyladenosine(37)-C(2))-methylthiotransferase MtaB [bacterium]|nr:tRNA (N(6)-L-threonylcarbamoyladenosine(37)-C(2))-methylthiotransferase MtaB [bacterium]
MKTVAFKTLGCKLNQFETWAIKEEFEKEGFQTVSFREKADVFVINTCTVTSRADYKSRYEIRQAIKRNGHAFIVVTGCYAQTNPETIQKIPGVSLIVGNKEKRGLVQYLTHHLSSITHHPIVKVGDISNHTQFTDLEVSCVDSTRAFVKIQDGCNSFCSYCKVPYARGPNRSADSKKVVKKVKEFVDKKYKEVVLTGVNLGTYGKDLKGEEDLVSLLKSLLKIEELERLRLSSIEPNDISSDLIALVASNAKICKHLHIPLQSGDSEILSSMKRRYTISKYVALIDKLTSTIPDVSIGTDIIVGFPKETEQAFLNTYNLAMALPFAYMHIFPYSKREGTEAAKVPDQISPSVKHERTEKLRRLSKQKSFYFRKRYEGKTLSCLVLNTRDSETHKLVGLTSNYIRILFDGEDGLMNRILDVTITDVTYNNTFGKVY